MTSAQIKTLLSPSDASLSETRALEYLDSNFSTWESIEQLSNLDAEVERTRFEAQDLEKRSGESQKVTDTFIFETIQQTKTLLDSAQELSLKRHLIADDILALRDELAPVDPEGKSTLLSELEELHKRISELEGAKSYVQVLERGLRLRGFMEHFIQPLLDKSSFHDVNAQNEFTRLLFPILARKIRKSVPQLLAQPSLLAHTIYQALLFDAAVRESGFTLANTWEQRETKQHKAKEWPGVADIILSHKSWFDQWMDAERHFTEHQYNEIIISPDAFAFSNDGNEDYQQTDVRPTNSARRIKALLEQVTERYQPLPHYNQRARFLITVQVPILETYYGRISSSLDAFETLSSSFVRAVPGALAGQVGAGVDARKLTSGHEGLQRLLKAYASASAIKGAMQEWGDSIFFLELWTEINERSALRAKVDAHPSLPQTTPASVAEEVHGTLFDELISQYTSIVVRAEDMMVRHVCSEVEGELRGYFSKQWEANNDADEELVAIPATLVSPLTTLTTHISLLVKTLPSSTTASLYRRIASSIASHILQRSVLHFGHGRMIPSRGTVFAREVCLWVEASQMAMPNRRVEAPWQRLLDGAKLVSIPEGPEFEAAKNAAWRASDEQFAEFTETIG
ncbi:unnamed protein product, partial [Rhizoctonia solani]